jgi:subtilisin family serine protease
VTPVLCAAEIDSDVANLSLGAYPVPRPGLGSFYGGFLDRATTHATREGTLLVTAAGNDAADLQHDRRVISIPNEAAQAVSVSATGPIGFNWGDEGLYEPTYTPANYTSYGTNAVTVAGGGGNYDPALPPGYYYDLVYNCIGEFPPEDPDAEEPVPDFDADPTYSYGWVAGTSMAAPQVAGTAALVKSQNPDSNPNRIESVLKRTARVPDGYDKSYYGAGIVDPLAAVRE